MTGEQLVTLCLEELQINPSSKLLNDIIQSDDLYDKMNQAYQSHKTEFDIRTNNPTDKIETLNKRRQQYLENKQPLDEKPDDDQSASSSPHSSIVRTLSPYLQHATSAILAALAANAVLLIILGAIAVTPPTIGVMLAGAAAIAFFGYCNYKQSKQSADDMQSACIKAGSQPT